MYDYIVNIRTKSLMSRCFDHKTIFPDTYRHFRPATEIPRKLPIVCRGLELKKSSSKNKVCLDTQPMNDKIDMFDFRTNNCRTPYAKKQGLSNAQFRIEIASELCIR